MCHHHTPIELLAERRTSEADEDEADAAATPTLTPPADD